MSSHLANIPEAVRIAGSVDSSIDPALKEQAIEYLQKVRVSSNETWQDCLALYLQGAGAAEGQTGADGKEKRGSDLRMFCQQIVDSALIHKSGDITLEQFQAIYEALVSFVKTEWVEGVCEGNQPFLRNKLAFTLAHLFLDSYPNPITTYLHPFFSLLTPSDPSSSTGQTNFHPALLTIRLLSEIALEVHDSTMKSARSWAKARQEKDGQIRDAVRASGDEKLAVDGLLGLTAKAIDRMEAGTSERAKWEEVATSAMKTLSAWTPWVDLGVTLTPDTLSFYQRLLRQPLLSLQTAGAVQLRTLVAKGVKEPAERLNVLRILDVVSIIDPLEVSTRDTKDDDEALAFRVAVAGVINIYGVQLIEFIDEEENSEQLRNEAESMMVAALPLLLRFYGDRRADVPVAVTPFVSDVLRLYKKWHSTKGMPPAPRGTMPPPAPSPPPLTEDRRKFLSALLDLSVRQLAWPDDAEWEPPGGDEPDPDDDIAKFWQMRTLCTRNCEAIAALDKSLHTEVVANIVVTTLNALQSGGPSSVSWQQAELALHLVYTFGELNKNNSLAAFFEMPTEMQSKAGRDRVRRISINKSHFDSEMASGRSTPTSDHAGEDALAAVQPGVYYGGPNVRTDYSQFPLTPLGSLLSLCQTAGIANYPHPSVTMEYFLVAVRYVEFWKAKEGMIQPTFEAMLDQRGIHHPNERVRRRCFYDFSKFVKECRTEVDQAMAVAILDSMKDLLAIEAKVPDADTPEEDVMLKAVTGSTYLSDQLHLFEAAGNLIYLTRSDAAKQMSLLEALAGPLMSGIGDGLQRPGEQQAILQVHHNLMALGHFAKGFPHVNDNQVEQLPYAPPFKQMTEALLEALNVMKKERVVRDGARFAFSQFVSAIGSTIAELVPRFVSSVVGEFETSELVDFLLFLGLLIHRLKNNTFETIDMLLLPLLSRIFAVLNAPINGTDEANTHRRLKDAYLTFFTALMNANLDGVFITERNKPEFENLLSALLATATDGQDGSGQRLAVAFFVRSVTAWGMSNAPTVFADSAMSDHSKAVANGSAAATNQHAVSKEQRAAQALPGYETFIYGRLLPLCFEIPAQPKFHIGKSVSLLHELAMLLRNTIAARGQEAIDVLANDMLPKINCPPQIAEQLISSLKTQQSRDFRKTFVEFVRALKGSSR